MDLKYINYMWSLVTNEKLFLDIEIQCCDGFVETNKCFLMFTGPPLNCVLSDCKEDQIKICMPEFTCLEVFHLTRGLSKFVLNVSENLIMPDFIPGEGEKELILTTKFVAEKKVPKVTKSKIKSVSSRSTSKCCSFCGLQFESSLKLAKHSYKVHPKSEPTFECKLCLEKFHYKHILNQHELRKHSNLSFSCDSCNKSFSLKSNLLKHRRKFHENYNKS